MPKTSEQELTTWKEIAAHLGVSVRTAQNYSQAGLPVRRVLGIARGRVIAYKAELDQWKAERFGGKVLEAQPEKPGGSAENRPLDAGRVYEPEAVAQPPRKIVAWRWILKIAGAFVAAVLAVLVIYAGWGHSQKPVAYKTEISTLIALDGQNREVWRHPFDHPLAPDHYEYPLDRERGVFSDIDGDGRAEMLFVEFPEHWRSTGATLRCFSPEGKERWSFVPGRSVVTTGAGDQFFPPYYISAVSVIRSPSWQARIVVSSNHNMDAPTQVAVLDHHGRKVGEYWHPGHLLHLAHADLDGDGKEEMLLAGVNNGYHSAALLVFDPLKVAGTSSAVPDRRFQLLGFPTGTERAAVLFPRTCVSKDLPYNRVGELQVRGNRLYAVVAEGVSDTSSPTIIYELDFHLNVLSVSASVEYQAAHSEMTRAGILNHAFTSEELEQWKKAVIKQGALQ